jgi:hypothetical protein
MGAVYRNPRVAEPLIAVADLACARRWLDFETPEMIKISK